MGWTRSRRCRACCARSARPGPAPRRSKDPAAALHAAVRRVRRRDVRGPQVIGREGRRATVETIGLGETRVYNTLQFTSALGPVRAGLPAALQSLARGDAAPFVHLGGLDRRPRAPRRSARRDRLPFSMSRLLRARCASRRGCRGARIRRVDARQAAETRTSTRSARGRSRRSAPTRSRRPAPRAVLELARDPRARAAARGDAGRPGARAVRARGPDHAARAGARGRRDLPARDAARGPARRPLRAERLRVRAGGGGDVHGRRDAGLRARTTRHSGGRLRARDAAGRTAIAQATIDGVRRHLEASRELFGAHTRYELWG